MSHNNVAIFVGTKGRGSNMSALLAAGLQRVYPVDSTVVVSPVADSPAAASAREQGFDVEVASSKIDDYADRLSDLLKSRKIDWICLAGMMTKLPPGIVASYSGRILNVHPSLLPKFGGKGMYGRHVHEAVIASGETISGCTVHFVTEEYDEGQIILQKTCSVLPGDTPESLAERVLKLEHVAFPEALRMVIVGEVIHRR